MFISAEKCFNKADIFEAEQRAAPRFLSEQRRKEGEGVHWFVLHVALIYMSFSIKYTVMQSDGKNRKITTFREAINV